MQVYVDAATPAELWDILRKAVEEYTADHPESFTGQCAIFCFGAKDPLKLLLGVYFEYSFNGTCTQPFNAVMNSCKTFCIQTIIPAPAKRHVPASYAGYRLPLPLVMTSSF